MFEYMAAGLPFVASDFSLWDEIIQKYHCGLCVPVDDQRKIQSAITYLLSHKNEAQEMGRNGREAVEKEFNWNIEREKLLQLYRKDIYFNE